MSSTIAVEELRVGMYIHLEGGWLSHPFPLSSFRIASPDQIQTLRGLGLGRVRWLPEKSDPQHAAANANATVASGAPGAATAPLVDPGAEPGVDAAAVVLTSAAVGTTVAANEPHLADPSLAPLHQPSTAAPASHTQAQAEAQAAAQRGDWLAAQRNAAQRCERQYGEAATAWRGISDSVVSQPKRAGRTGEALTRAILDKMLATQDVGIRLLSDQGGDKQAAHALNVTVISLLIGRTLSLSQAEMVDLGVGALLHDVGKIDVAERHRHAEEGCSPAETAAYRDHVVKGVMQGQRMALSAGALTILAQHHEHTDGSGFPLHVQADRLSMGARIVAIVNRYDNLCNPSGRTPALTPHEAVAMLFAQGRARYDTTVLNAFIRMMGVYPAGSLVQLTDERFAMVVGVNSSRPLKPRVLVVGSPPHTRAIEAASLQAQAASGPHAELLDLEAVPDLGIRRSLPPNKLPPAALQALDPRPRVSYYFESLAEQPLLERAA